MRMFRITINGKRQPPENAGGRSVLEYQHSIVERMKESGIRNPLVRVQEYITGGATASPRRDEEN